MAVLCFCTFVFRAFAPIPSHIHLLLLSDVWCGVVWCVLLCHFVCVPAYVHALCTCMRCACGCVLHCVVLYDTRVVGSSMGHAKDFVILFGLIGSCFAGANDLRGIVTGFSLLICAKFRLPQFFFLFEPCLICLIHGHERLQQCAQTVNVRHAQSEASKHNAPLVPQLTFASTLLRAPAPRR